MKNRNLPYGYYFAKGYIAVQPLEQAIVTEIYDGYLSGKSLLNISAELNAQNIEFMPGIVGWNKARLKRILEDERYIGYGDYPAIITQEIYDAIQIIKHGIHRKAWIGKLISFKSPYPSDALSAAVRCIAAQTTEPNAVSDGLAEKMTAEN